MKTTISSEALTHFGAAKIAFPKRPDGHTDGQTDICNYRVGSLLKRKRNKDDNIHKSKAQKISQIYSGDG